MGCLSFTCCKFRLQYEGADESDCNNTNASGDYPELGRKSVCYKVQDRELLEMADNGACLSLHQPWASLLVYGIMRFLYLIFLILGIHHGARKTFKRRLFQI